VKPRSAQTRSVRSAGLWEVGAAAEGVAAFRASALVVLKGSVECGSSSADQLQMWGF